LRQNHECTEKAEAKHKKGYKVPSDESIQKLPDLTYVPLSSFKVEIQICLPVVIQLAVNISFDSC